MGEIKTKEMTKQKAKQHLQDLITKYGYWSKEVNQFNSTLPIRVMVEINNEILKKT